MHTPNKAQLIISLENCILLFLIYLVLLFNSAGFRSLSKEELFCRICKKEIHFILQKSMPDNYIWGIHENNRK